jgi:hypothetical protein
MPIWGWAIVVYVVFEITATCAYLYVNRNK